MGSFGGLAAAVSIGSPATAPSRVIIRAATEFVLTGVAEGVRAYGRVRRSVVLAAIARFDLPAQPR
jgi:hypothetical protein